MKILYDDKDGIGFNADKIISFERGYNDSEGHFIRFDLGDDYFYHFCSSEKSAKDFFSRVCAFLTDYIPQNYFTFFEEVDFND